MAVADVSLKCYLRRRVTLYKHMYEYGTHRIDTPIATKVVYGLYRIGTWAGTNWQCALQDRVQQV
jgi:hypothetical protein